MAQGWRAAVAASFHGGGTTDGVIQPCMFQVSSMMLVLRFDLHPGTGSEDVYIHAYIRTQACDGSGWNCWPLPQHLPATTKTFLYQAGANPPEKPTYGCHQPFILCPARLAEHTRQQGSADTDLLRPQLVARLATTGHGLLRTPVRQLQPPPRRWPGPVTG